MKRFIFGGIIFFVFTSSVLLHSQWAITYGESGDDEANCIQQTRDGGFIVAGKTGNTCWILKLTSEGEIEWQRTYGYEMFGYSISYAGASSIQQTEDGGYIATGGSYESYDDFTYVLKLTSKGDIEWLRYYWPFASTRSRAYSIQQTRDGGFVIGADYYHHDYGYYHSLFIKLSPSGEVENFYEYEAYLDNFTIWQTKDGGYIAAGGSSVFIVMKLSSKGNIKWSHSYGGNKADVVYSIQQTKDRGYIAAGLTFSFGAGLSDCWILKLSSNGDIEWQRTYGGKRLEGVYSIQQTKDGGYIAAGSTSSFGAGAADCWILKLSSNGEIEWQRTYGGKRLEEIYSIKQLKDGGYIAAGWTDSYGAGGRDFFVLKLCSNGDIDPSCKLIKSSDALVSDTSVEPQYTNISGYDDYLDAGESPYFFEETNVIPNVVYRGRIPPAPKKLKAKALFWDQIRLKWRHKSKLEYGFRIERKKGKGGKWTQIEVTETNVKAYLDRELEESTRYRYRVRAYNAIGSSEFSNVALAKTKKKIEGFPFNLIHYFPSLFKTN